MTQLNGVRVEASGLSKAVGGRPIVEDIGFVAEPGTTTAVIGRNGAGKSTMFKLMTGIVVGGGQTTYDGLTWHQLPSPRRLVGAYLGTFPFHSGSTVSAHLDLVAAMTDLPRSRVQDVAEQFGLTTFERTRVEALSAGSRQRLGLAAALLPDPPVLILDEPFNAHDPAEADHVYRSLSDLAGDGRTILVATHHLERLEPHATRALVLKAGRLVADSAIGPGARLTTLFSTHA